LNACFSIEPGYIPKEGDFVTFIKVLMPSTMTSAATDGALVAKQVKPIHLDGDMEYEPGEEIVDYDPNEDVNDESDEEVVEDESGEEVVNDGLEE
jgi:hypothetical protein